MVERQGTTTLRMRGRFTRSWRVRLVFRIRARPEQPRDPRRPGFCTAGPSVINLNHLGVAPFRDCRTHQAETVAQSSEGRVFLHYRRSGPSLLKRAYGCLFSTNERVFIEADDEDGIWPRQFRLAGPYVGYVVTFCGGIGCSSAFYIKDLRNGVERRLPNLAQGVADFVVSPNAAVAVITPAGMANTPEVRIVIGDSGEVIDSGEGIDPSSLELEGSVLSWIKDGIRRTAPLE